MYEKEYGIKFYDFEVLSNENALTKESTYTGSIVTSPKYDETTLINDVLDDTSTGDAPVFVNVDEDKIENIYAAYVDWFNENIEALVSELDDIKTVVEGTYDADENKFYVVKEPENATDITVIEAFYHDGKIYKKPVIEGTVNATHDEDGDHYTFFVNGEQLTFLSGGDIYFDKNQNIYLILDSDTSTLVEETDLSNIIFTNDDSDADNVVYHDVDSYQSLLDIMPRIEKIIR